MAACRSGPADPAPAHRTTRLTRPETLMRRDPMDLVHLLGIVGPATVLLVVLLAR
ncbi:hypothetical protein [Kitasatospora sp. NPDC088351]|uniref:hypothetical protein n=1 Tax=Kitasatospora sp. NPDC088351 TaxID=3155180 RepID=UPI0034382B5E